MASADTFHTVRRKLAIGWLSHSLESNQTETIIDLFRQLGSLEMNVGCEPTKTIVATQGLSLKNGSDNNIERHPYLQTIDGMKMMKSHVLGEAFELYCAMAFKYRDYPVILRHYEAFGNGKTNEFIACTVENVYMSDNVPSDCKGLCWEKMSSKYVEERTQLLIKDNGADLKNAELFLKELKKNMEADTGFDILVELKETSEPKRLHFLLVQCKFRSDENHRIDMSKYIAKAYNIETLARAANTLCPFFWMSTLIDADTLEYWNPLTSSGRVVLYGLNALDQDAKALRLLERMKEVMKKWRESSELSKPIGAL